MIFSKRKITIVGDKANIDKQIVLYRGDREIEIQFEIVYEVIRYRMSNAIEEANASFGQLIIQNDSASTLTITDVSPTSEGAVIFKFTKEMIDEISELGTYNFQIRLFDDTQTSRITTPIVENGIIIKEPLSIYEGDSKGGSAEVGVALTGTARVQQEEHLEPFDEASNYNETTWATGDIITSGKLNKLEDGITGVNQKVKGITVPTKTSQLTNDNGFATETFVTNKIAEAQLSGEEVDLSGYVTKEVGNASQITFLDGQTFQNKLDSGTLKGEKGDKGDKGEQGPQGPAGTDGLTTSIRLNGVTYTQQDGVITLPNISGGEEVVPVAQVEPAELDVPKVFFYGNALPTTKDNVNLEMDYKSNTMRFHSYIKLKCQGTSSMNYAKKNFTLTLYEDEARSIKLEKNFKGWGNQNKFCLKANWVDSTHTRNISGARIACDMVESRPDSSFKQELSKCPRNGVVDGFPIKVYFNGEFWGIYTFNIPKDTWMFNMDDSNPNHVVLCAERNTDGNASLINSCQFRQLWDGVDGGDWSYEIGTPSDAVKNSLNRCISFVMNSSDQEFHDNIGEYFDLYSLLDYYCFSYIACHLDGLAKNMLLATYDGVIWGASLYDMDSIYGAQWNGDSFVSPQYQCPEQYQEQFSRLWERIEQCFATELKTRYAELRRQALSLTNIVGHVEEIYDLLSPNMKTDEITKWPTIPKYDENTITRFRNYMRDRAKYTDAQIQALGTTVSCTAISLDKDTLSINGAASTASLNKDSYVAQATPTGALSDGYYGCFTEFYPVKTGDVVSIELNTEMGNGLYVITSDTPTASSEVTSSLAWDNSSKTNSYTIKEGEKYISFRINSTWETKVVDIKVNGSSILNASDSSANYKITATVTPTDTTDRIIWSSNPTGIVTVNNGIVTPIANGTCTITATCGSHSATCNVTVSGIVNDTSEKSLP